MQGDAGTTAAFAGAVPVDVLLLCGIFGNVKDNEVERTLRAVLSLLAHSEPCCGPATEGPDST